MKKIKPTSRTLLDVYHKLSAIGHRPILALLFSLLLIVQSLFSSVPQAHATDVTFSYTGAQQTWVVPAGITSVTVDLYGAGGVGGSPGKGGRVQTTLAVTPGETLYLYVGGTKSGTTGGFNGGANAGSESGPFIASDGGGGASDIRQGGAALSNRVIVAGGGGGGTPSANGGMGGTTTGQAGGNANTDGFGGGGGTPSAGGAGGVGTTGIDGSAGSLGNGGGGGNGSGDGQGGGGGGGGYYGGGGGEGGDTANPGAGGGGGGSSFAGTGTSNTTHTQGYVSATGNGQIIITYTDLPPTITTPTQASITATTATLGGNVTSGGTVAVTGRGVCVGTSINPTTGCTSTTGTTGVFTVSATGLTQATLYHYRAYATNSVGTSYTTDDTFTTATPVAPTVSVSAETNVDSNSTTLNGTVNPGFSATSAWYFWGTSNVGCSSLPNATTSQSLGSGGSNVALTAALTGFVPGTTYYYCAVAANSYGVTYGTTTSFTQGSASGCSSVNLTTDYTASSSCVFGNSTTDGVDKGTGTTNTAVLTVAKDTTLTVGANQTVAYGTIYKPGATVVRLSGGTLRRSPVWVPDADADGYPDNLGTQGQVVQATQPSGYARRAVIVATNKDCDSTDATKFKNYVSYVDVDADAYTTTAAQALICSGSTLTGGSATSSGVDCNDANINAYTNQNVGTDVDQDGSSTSTASSQCMGASSTVSSRTYYKNSASTYSFIASASIVNTSDCLDSDADIYQNVSVGTDADQDGYSTASAASVCVGVSSTVSGRTYYVNSAGAVTLVASASIRAPSDCNDASASVGPCTSGVIIPWPSTNASIPAGWTRVTTMDDRYPKGTAAGVEPNVTGGAATHTHTDPGHTHSIALHTHTGGNTGDNLIMPLLNEYGQPNNSLLVGPTTGGNIALHTHSLGTLSSVSGTSGSTVGVWQSAANDPAFYRVIWIQSDGTTSGLPASSWAFWDNTVSLPTSWSNPAAARNVFPKGAVAAGDGGLSGGGAHTHTANSHTHGLGTHAHTGTTGAPSTVNGASSPHAFNASNTHTHTYTSAATASTSGSATSADSGSTSYEPTWAKLAVVQNDFGAGDIQARHAALWLGALASIPSGWQLCDGTNSSVDMRGKFVKGANDISEIGNTGGTAGHSHTDAASHTHSVAHTHNVTVNGSTDNPASLTQFAGSGTFYASIHGGHSHIAVATGSDGGTSGGTAQTSPSTADTQPSFRTVAFICYRGL